MSDAQVADLLQQGIAAVKAGHKEQARELLMQVIDLDERNEQAWLWLSGVVETTEDRRICLENVLAINPDNAHAQTGVKYMEQQAPAPAPVQEPATPSVGQDTCPRCESPISPSASECENCGLPLIITCPACGEYAEVHQSACPSCGRELGDFREGVQYYLTLAQAYLDGRRSRQAAEVMALAVKEAPDDPQVLESVGAFYERMGNSDGAISAYQQAAEFSPENAAYYGRLGALYQQTMLPAEARAMYERAMELGAKDSEIPVELSALYLEEGRDKECQSLLTRVLKKDPGNARAHLLLGDLYLAQKRMEQAFRHYRQARQLAPPSSETCMAVEQKLAKLQHAARRQAEVREASPRAGSGKRAAKKDRPGCLTVYAVLLGFGGAMGLLALIPMIYVLVAGGSTFAEFGTLMPDLGLLGGLSLAAVFGGVVGISLLSSIVNLALAVGLWNLKNWARIISIVLQSLGMLGAITQAVLTIGGARLASESAGLGGVPIFLVCSVLFGLVINGYILFWFVANGDLFD